MGICCCITSDLFEAVNQGKLSELKRLIESRKVKNVNDRDQVRIRTAYSLVGYKYL